MDIDALVSRFAGQPDPIALAAGLIVLISLILSVLTNKSFFTRLPLAIIGVLCLTNADVAFAFLHDLLRWVGLPQTRDWVATGLPVIGALLVLASLLGSLRQPSKPRD